MAFAALCASAEAQGLENFRAPNSLESAYVGVAAALNEPSLCARISPIAMNRVRKPSLTRSLCFYHAALAASDVRLCADVLSVPLETGMMTWLSPERCRLQVEGLRGSKRPAPPASHLDAFFNALGYDSGAGADPDWKAFFDRQRSDPALLAELKKRLAEAPDFSGENAAANGFTHEEAQREKAWVLGRALRLCASGRSDAACDDAAISLVRGQALRDAGLADASPPSGYRRPTGIELGLLTLADMLRDPDLCAAIGDDALSVGWSQEPGLSFTLTRSACYIRQAFLTADPVLCNSAKPLGDALLDGARATPENCRRAIAEGGALFPAPHAAPDWAGLMTRLGYADGSAALNNAAAQPLAARLANPTNAKRHSEFRARLSTFARTYKTSPGEREALAYSTAALMQSAYQFSATRFHCAIDWSDVAGRDPGQPQAYWTPDRPSFALIDQHGRQMTEASFAGEYVLVYFGFTSCPDVCPLSLAAIKLALANLEDHKDKITPLFITLDAERDTPEVLDYYVNLFGDNFIGLTGTADEIARAARSFNVYYFAGDIDGVYTVEHTSYFYLMGPDGRTLKYFDHGVDPLEMAAEIRTIIEGADGNAEQAEKHASPWWNFNWVRKRYEQFRNAENNP